MTGRKNGRLFECVLVDLGTQYDYCDAHGRRPVANVEELIPALRRTVAWAKRNRTPVISSLESHRAFEYADNELECSCRDGSNGQRKIGFTIFPQSICIEADNTLSCPLDLFEAHQQIIFRKRSEDLLENPKADRFLSQLDTKEYIVFGIALENSVKALALGLLARQKRVLVVTDACGFWNRARAELAKRQMIAKGAQFITIDELRQRKLDRSWIPWVTHVGNNGSKNATRRGGRSNGHGQAEA